MDYLEPKETERLMLRPLSMDDVTELEPFYLHPKTTRYFPESMRGDTRQAEIFIRKQLGRYLSNSFGHHGLIEKSTNSFVGVCGLLLQYVNGEEELELGYHLLPKYWGNGFATEAGLFFRDFAFKEAQMESLISIIHIDNIPSQRVATRMGMSPDGKLTYGGLTVDIYRITSETFNGLTAAKN